MRLLAQNSSVSWAQERFVLQCDLKSTFPTHLPRSTSQLPPCHPPFLHKS